MSDIFYPDIVNNDLPSINNNDILHDDMVISMFLETKERGSYKTAIIYKGILKDFFSFVQKPIQIISHRDVLDYIDYLSVSQPNRKALKVSTQNMKLSVVKSFFKYLLQLGYVKLNPAEPIPTKKRQINITNRLLTEGDLKKLFKVVDDRRKVEQVILYFLASTGCRVSELCNARMKDFFITPKGYIGITVHGKGGKDRIRKIRPMLWEMISEYRKEKGMPTAINYEDISPVIFTPAGNPYTTAAIWKIIKNIVNAAGLSENISTHWFRHTFATFAASNGVDIWKLKDEMGHASINTTEIYVHIAQDMEKTSVDEISYIEEIEELLNHNK